MQELRKLRQKHGLYQRELAQMVGLTRAGIAMLEAGSTNPSIQVAVQLADALGVSLDTLMGREEIPAARRI